MGKESGNGERRKEERSRIDLQIIWRNDFINIIVAISAPPCPSFDHTVSCIMHAFSLPSVDLPNRLLLLWALRMSTLERVFRSPFD